MKTWPKPPRPRLQSHCTSTDRHPAEPPAAATWARFILQAIETNSKTTLNFLRRQFQRTDAQGAQKGKEKKGRATGPTQKLDLRKTATETFKCEVKVSSYNYVYVWTRYSSEELDDLSAT